MARMAFCTASFAAPETARSSWGKKRRGTVQPSAESASESGAEKCAWCALPVTLVGEVNAVL